MTKTKISKVLNDCKFDPRKAGSLKVIVDLDNTSYFKCRAIELIKIGNQKSITMAIQLLAVILYREYFNGPIQSAKKATIGKKDSK